MLPIVLPTMFPWCYPPCALLHDTIWCSPSCSPCSLVSPLSSPPCSSECPSVLPACSPWSSPQASFNILLRAPLCVHLSASLCATSSTGAQGFWGSDLPPCTSERKSARSSPQPSSEGPQTPGLTPPPLPAPVFVPPTKYLRFWSPLSLCMHARHIGTHGRPGACLRQPWHAVETTPSTEPWCTQH